MVVPERVIAIDPVVAAAERELGGLEGVGLAVAGLFAQGRVRLGHEPGGAAADDRDPLAAGRAGPGESASLAACRQQSGWLAISALT